jgi:hypothetical protein
MRPVRTVVRCSAPASRRPGDLGVVADPETRERYAREASRMADEHDPDDAI